MLAQLLHTACHRRLLLADGDIDADHVLALLVDNGVDGDRRLAGLTVADDQLTLAASDGDQGVDGLDTGLHRNRHRTARNHAGGRALNRPSLGGVDFTAAVDGIAEGIDHTADHLLAHRHFDDASAAADLIAFLQAGIVAQQHDADVVLLQVHHHAAQIPVEFNQLARHGIRYAGDAADAVGDADNGPLLVDRRFPVRLGKFFLQRIDERFVIVFQDIDRIPDPLQHALEGAVIDGVADFQVGAADQALIRAGRDPDLILCRGLPRLMQGVQDGGLYPDDVLFRRLCHAVHLHRDEALLLKGHQVAAGDVELFLRPVDQAFRHPGPGIGVLFVRQENRRLIDHLFHGVAGQGGARGLCLILQGLLVVLVQLFHRSAAQGLRALLLRRRGLARRAQDAGALLLSITVGLVDSIQKRLCVCRRSVRRLERFFHLGSAPAEHLRYKFSSDKIQCRRKDGKVNQPVNQGIPHSHSPVIPPFCRNGSFCLLFAQELFRQHGRKLRRSLMKLLRGFFLSLRKCRFRIFPVLHRGFFCLLQHFRVVLFDFFRVQSKKLLCLFTASGLFIQNPGIVLFDACFGFLFFPEFCVDSGLTLLHERDHRFVQKAIE